MEISQACIDAGVHVADIVIKEVKDPTQRAINEHDRSLMVRRTEQLCTLEAWTEEHRKCVLDAKTVAEWNACGKKFAPPQPKQLPVPAEPPPTGSGAPKGAVETKGAGSKNPEPKAQLPKSATPKTPKTPAPRAPKAPKGGGSAT